MTLTEIIQEVKATLKLDAGGIAGPKTGELSTST